jgi:hypothetical protein
MYAVPVGDSAYRPRFSWAIQDNNPRFGVFLNNAKEKGDKGDFIYGGFSFDVFLTMLCEAIEFFKDDSKKGSTVKMANYYNEKDESGKVTGKVLTTLLVFGIDEDGMRWIMGVDKKKKETPKVKFYYQMSDYHSFICDDGKPLTKEEASKRIAVNSLSSIKDFLNNYSAVAKQSSLVTAVDKTTTSTYVSKEDDIPY